MCFRSLTSFDPTALIVGFVASLLAAAIWVTIATWWEMPISTTHSIIGALIGFGVVYGGLESVNWMEVGSVASSWVLSPVAGCILSFIVFKFIVYFIFARERPVESTKIIGPLLIGATAFIISASLLFKTYLGCMLSVSDTDVFIVSIGVSVVVIILSFLVLNRIKTVSTDDYMTVENIFRRIQIVTSCYVAFSIGANDVANAIGPVAAITPLASSGVLLLKNDVPLYLLILGV